MAPFSLPSLPSLSSLLDPSPSVFYPDHPQSRPTTSASPSSSRHSPPTPTQHLGNLLSASVSATDLSGREWEPLASRSSAHPQLQPHPTLARRSSVSSHSQLNYTRPPTPTSPVRPSHRRSHSALPAQQTVRPAPSPLGRLHEFSRNPLASTSAVSLPTLAEMDVCPSREVGMQGEGPGPPVSSAAAAAKRGRQRTSTASSLSSSSPIEAAVASSLTRQPSVSIVGRGRTPGTSHARVSSVPPPLGHQPRPVSHAQDQNQTQIEVQGRSRSRNEMPPPPVPPSSARPTRPLASPRSWSFQDLPSCTSSTTRRPSVCSIHSATGTTGEEGLVGISDVAVLATWSFPSSHPPSDQRGRGNVCEDGPASGRLRDRLRSLSTLDTSATSLDSTPRAPHVPEQSRHQSPSDRQQPRPLVPRRQTSTYLNRHKTSVAHPDNPSSHSSSASLSSALHLSLYSADTPPSHVESYFPTQAAVYGDSTSTPRPNLSRHRATQSTCLRRPNPLSMPGSPASLLSSSGSSGSSQSGVLSSSVGSGSSGSSGDSRDGARRGGLRRAMSERKVPLSTGQFSPVRVGRPLIVDNTHAAQAAKNTRGEAESGNDGAEGGGGGWWGWRGGRRRSVSYVERPGSGSGSGAGPAVLGRWRLGSMSSSDLTGRAPTFSCAAKAGRAAGLVGGGVENVKRKNDAELEVDEGEGEEPEGYIDFDDI